MKYKSNKNLEFIKDRQKSYVFVKEKEKDIGLFYWSYIQKKWIFVQKFVSFFTKEKYEAK